MPGRRSAGSDYAPILGVDGRRAGMPWRSEGARVRPADVLAPCARGEWRQSRELLLRLAVLLEDRAGDAAPVGTEDAGRSAGIGPIAGGMPQGGDAGGASLFGGPDRPHGARGCGSSAGWPSAGVGDGSSGSLATPWARVDGSSVGWVPHAVEGATAVAPATFLRPHGTRQSGSSCGRRLLASEMA